MGTSPTAARAAVTPTTTSPATSQAAPAWPAWSSSGKRAELDEVEDLLADGVRLATRTGDLGTAETLSGHAAALAAGSEIPHRQASTLYCRGLLDHDAARLLAAAERYDEAGRPLLIAKSAGGRRR